MVAVDGRVGGGGMAMVDIVAGAVTLRVKGENGTRVQEVSKGGWGAASWQWGQYCQWRQQGEKEGGLKTYQGKNFMPLDRGVLGFFFGAQRNNFNTHTQ